MEITLRVFSPSNIRTKCTINARMRKSQPLRPPLKDGAVPTRTATLN